MTTTPDSAPAEGRDPLASKDYDEAEIACDISAEQRENQRLRAEVADLVSRLDERFEVSEHHAPKDWTARRKAERERDEALAALEVAGERREADEMRGRVRVALRSLTPADISLRGARVIRRALGAGEEFDSTPAETEREALVDVANLRTIERRYGHAYGMALAGQPNRMPELAHEVMKVLQALLDELEASRSPRPATEAAEEVLVEGFYLPVADLPRILGNYMRSADESAREAKEAVRQRDELAEMLTTPLPAARPATVSEEAVEAVERVLDEWIEVQSMSNRTKARKIAAALPLLTAQPEAEVRADERERVAQRIEALPGPGEVALRGWSTANRQGYLIAIEEAAAIARTAPAHDGSEGQA